MFDPIDLEQAFTAILGKDVDILSYAGLDPEVDRDVLNDMVLV